MVRSASMSFPTRNSLRKARQCKDLEFPDRVLIGSRETEEGLKARQSIVDIYANWMPRERIIESNIWSSELSKLVANAFLAQRISSINAISALCEKTDADVQEVAKAIGLDSRLGSKFLNASVGFGGRASRRTSSTLSTSAEATGSRRWRTTGRGRQDQRIPERTVYSDHAQRHVQHPGRKENMPFGFAFKADTGDTRETPALYIAKRLVEERAEVVITDPQALANAR